MRQAPLVFAVFLLITCRFEFQLTEPSAEVDGKSAYQTGSSIIIDYKFTADEPSLRCKYAVNTAGSVVKQGVTDAFPPGTWQQLSIALDPNPAEGEYNVQLMAQAPRGDGFVNLAFLTKTFEFFLDSENPVEPEFSPGSGLFSNSVQVTLSHPEWREPSGSPVSIYYTIDHSYPTSSSIRYVVGSPITIDISEPSFEIKAIAIDDSGRKSDIRSEIYNFFHIEYATSTGYPNPDNPNKFNTALPDQYIYPHGYGLSNVISAEFKDADGTAAVTSIMLKSQTDLTIAVVFNSEFQGDGTTGDGTLRLIDASGISDEITIDLVPEP